MQRPSFKGEVHSCARHAVKFTEMTLNVTDFDKIRMVLVGIIAKCLR